MGEKPRSKLEVLIMTTRLNWYPVCYTVVFVVVVVVTVTVALALVLPVDDMVNRVVRLVADNLEY